MDLTKQVQDHPVSAIAYAKRAAAESAAVLAWPRYDVLAEELADETFGAYAGSEGDGTSLSLFLSDPASTLPRRLAARGITFEKRPDKVSASGIVLVHQSDGLTLRIWNYQTPGCRVETVKRMVEVTEHVSICGDGEVPA